MRSIALPIENLVVGRLHCLRRESQFDKWSDSTRQKVIVELVYFGPVVNVLPVLDANRAQYVVKDGVEADVAEAEFVDSRFELRLAVVANECARKVGAYRQVEEPVERSDRLCQVEVNAARCWTGWVRRKAHRGKRHAECGESGEAFDPQFLHVDLHCECLLNNGARDGASCPPAGSPRHPYRRRPSPPRLAAIERRL